MKKSLHQLRFWDLVRQSFIVKSPDSFIKFVIFYDLVLKVFDCGSLHFGSMNLSEGQLRKVGRKLWKTWEKSEEVRKSQELREVKNSVEGSNRLHTHLQITKHVMCKYVVQKVPYWPPLIWTVWLCCIYMIF